MQHALLPTDFSETAHAALNRALPLVELTGARITILHVICRKSHSEAPVGLKAIESLSKAMDLDRDPSRCVPGNDLATIRSAAAKNLDRVVSTLDLPSVTLETAVREGRPAAEIIDFANANGVDLIVMSTHGHGPVGRMFLGSVTDNVLRAASCPVLSVRR